MAHLVILLVVGAVIGLTAQRIEDRRMPYGWLGAVVAGLFGAWLMTDGLHIAIAPQLTVADVPLLTPIVGAIIVVFLWSMVTRSSHFSDRHARLH